MKPLIAEVDGTYPKYGVSGSYWYTKGALYVTPTVRTDPATLVTFNSARLNANLTEQGGEALIEVGFQWGETVTDNTVKVTDQSEGAYILKTDPALTRLLSIISGHTPRTRTKPCTAPV